MGIGEWIASVFILPLNVGDTVLVAFGKKDLIDAVILG